MYGYGPDYWAASPPPFYSLMVILIFIFLVVSLFRRA